MSIYILVLAFIYAGEVRTATFNDGDASKEYVAYPTVKECETERTRQLAVIAKALPEGALFLELRCVERKGEGV